ncbi:hypothetical protein QX220_20245, partial [Vibrio vulnificus]|nr:hypothetical protein [Vibrio vulnificus]
LLLLMAVPLVWYNNVRREVRPSHQSRKRMENKWAEALSGNPPKEVKVEINSILKAKAKGPLHLK